MDTIFNKVQSPLIEGTGPFIVCPCEGKTRNTAIAHIGFTENGNVAYNTFEIKGYRLKDKRDVGVPIKVTYKDRLLHFHSSCLVPKMVKGEKRNVVSILNTPYPSMVEMDTYEVSRIVFLPNKEVKIYYGEALVQHYDTEAVKKLLQTGKGLKYNSADFQDILPGMSNLVNSLILKSIKTHCHAKFQVDQNQSPSFNINVPSNRSEYSG